MKEKRPEGQRRRAAVGPTNGLRRCRRAAILAQTPGWGQCRLLRRARKRAARDHRDRAPRAPRDTCAAPPATRKGRSAAPRAELAPALRGATPRRASWPRALRQATLGMRTRASHDNCPARICAARRAIPENAGPSAARQLLADDAARGCSSAGEATCHMPAWRVCPALRPLGQSAPWRAPAPSTCCTRCAMSKPPGANARNARKFEPMRRANPL
eukprot:3824859-Pyramimonas_sp.AAC.1